MRESLPYDEIMFHKNVKFENIINTLDYSDVGYFVEVDSKFLDILKEKTKHSVFALRTELILKINLVII